MKTPGLRFIVLLIALGAAGAVGASSPSKAYDALVVTRTLDPQYPAKLAEQFVDKGEARIMVMVDQEGQLVDWLVTGYTHPLFAKEVLDVLPKWKFQPARLHGEPVTVRTELRFLFTNSKFVRVVRGDKEMDLWLRTMRGKDALWHRMCRMEELDRLPDTIVEISPMPPDRLGAVAREGRVVVEYLIDAEGRVRMPLVLSSDDDAFTQSVLLAISEWRYVTPTRDGQPVLARVAREFNFQQVNRTAPDRT